MDVLCGASVAEDSIERSHGNWRTELLDAWHWDSDIAIYLVDFGNSLHCLDNCM